MSGSEKVEQSVTWWGLVLRVAVVALVAAACSETPSGRGSGKELTLPHHDSKVSAGSRVEGRLTLIEMCPFLESSRYGGPLLILWPQSLEGRATESGFDIVNQDVVLASEGDLVELAGAEPFRTPPDPDAFSPPIPDMCMEQAAGYWAAGGISRL